MPEPDLLHQIHLIREAPGRVLFIDVIEHLPAVTGAARGFEILSVPSPHLFLYALILMQYQVAHKKRSSGFEEVVYLPETAFPICVVAKVMEHRRRDDYVIMRGGQGELPEIPVECPDHSGVLFSDALPCALEHWEAQVGEVAVYSAPPSQNGDSVVPGPAPYI